MTGKRPRGRRMLSDLGGTYEAVATLKHEIEIVTKEKLTADDGTPVMFGNIVVYMSDTQDTEDPDLMRPPLASALLTMPLDQLPMCQGAPFLRNDLPDLIFRPDSDQLEEYFPGTIPRIAQMSGNELGGNGQCTGKRDNLAEYNTDQLVCWTDVASVLQNFIRHPETDSLTDGGSGTDVNHIQAVPCDFQVGQYFICIYCGQRARAPEHWMEWHKHVFCSTTCLEQEVSLRCSLTYDAARDILNNLTGFGPTSPRSHVPRLGALQAPPH